MSKNKRINKKTLTSHLLPLAVSVAMVLSMLRLPPINTQIRTLPADNDTSANSDIKQLQNNDDSNPGSNSPDNQTTNIDELSLSKDTQPKLAKANKPQAKKSRYVQEYVLGDYIYRSGSNEAEPLRTYKTQLVPNDPGSGQWWESSLKLNESWDISTGSSDTVLAIIDTGVALAHEEFTNRWHTNTSEQGATTLESPSQLNCTDRSITIDKSCNLVDDDFDGIVDNELGATTYQNPSKLNCTDQAVLLDKKCNMIDDDSNGLVDDWRGWDFINYDNSVQAGENNSTGSGTRHASYVTAVAAANANNGVGIAGVNWQTKILPLQAIDDNGYGNSISVGRAVRYAVDQGAKVISMSLGGVYPDAFLRQTIREAISAGAIVVAASGNDGCDCISYPANYSEVVAVGALATNNQPATFSSYGANLDILAPGTQIYTATWSTTNQTSGYASGIAGTSLATPLVSGALTTLKSLRPTASQTELLALLTETSDRLTLGATTPRSNTLGFGTSNVFAAAQRATTPKVFEQMTTFSSVAYGSKLYPVSPAELSSAITVYLCPIGTTAVYRLSKASTVFYSASLSEVVQAQSAGYTSSFFAYLCTLQSYDSVSSIRILNLFKEFEDRFVHE